MSCAAHDWRPATGWYARYRCELFGVFGYKQPFIRTDEAGPAPGAFASDRVTPYLCSSNRGDKSASVPPSPRTAGYESASNTGVVVPRCRSAPRSCGQKKSTRRTANRLRSRLNAIEGLMGPAMPAVPLSRARFHPPTRKDHSHVHAHHCQRYDPKGRRRPAIAGAASRHPSQAAWCRPVPPGTA